MYISSGLCECIKENYLIFLLLKSFINNSSPHQLIICCAMLFERNSVPKYVKSDNNI